MTSTATLQVAQTIRDQLGNRFCVMTGAKDFVGSERSLSFRIGRNIRNVTHIRITLNVADLYDVEYMSVRGTSVNRAKCQPSFGVYADRLAAEIGRVTGLAVTL
jgi:hypothetical protein